MTETSAISACKFPTDLAGKKEYRSTISVALFASVVLFAAELCFCCFSLCSYYVLLCLYSTLHDRFILYSMYTIIIIK